MADIIPAPQKPQKLPIVLSPEEVRHFLSCVASPKHRTILTTCYAAGLRISEAVRLQPPEIDSQRMVIRVDQGKGQKDRYVMLSPRLLEILREWWRLEKPKGWLFPGNIPGRPITRFAVEEACQQAHRSSHISKPITPHSMRPAFAVHLLESGTHVRRSQLLLGHRSLATTARYLRIATSKVCSTTNPFDLLPQPAAAEPRPLHLRISEPAGRWSVPSSKWPRSSAASSPWQKSRSRGSALNGIIRKTILQYPRTVIKC